MILKRGFLATAGAAAALAPFAFPTTPAGARPAPRVTVSPSFTIINIDGTKGADRVAISCENDRLRLNGGPVLGGRARCLDIETLNISTYEGNDSLNIPELSDPDAPFSERAHIAIRVKTGSGDDILTFTQNLREADLGAGDDRASDGSGDRTTVLGGAGDDLIKSIASTGTVFFDGGTGDDDLRGGKTSAVLSGGVGADTLNGGARISLLLAGNGDDLVAGGPKEDIVVSGGGDDVVRTGAGNDLIAGQGGRDDLAGGPKRDAIFGGPERDVISGGPGEDLQFQDAKPRRLGAFKHSWVLLEALDGDF